MQCYRRSSDVYFELQYLRPWHFGKKECWTKLTIDKRIRALLHVNTNRRLMNTRRDKRCHLVVKFSGSENISDIARVLSKMIIYKENRELWHHILKIVNYCIVKPQFGFPLLLIRTYSISFCKSNIFYVRSIQSPSGQERSICRWRPPAWRHHR